MNTNPSEHIQQQILWYGHYEKGSILTWELLLDREMTVLDIGANSGYYSLVAAPKAKKVYAFEPSSRIRESLEKNIELNHCKNISVQSYALGDAKDRKKFYHSDADNTGMSGLSEPENFSGETEIVETITLDEWMVLMQLNKADIIKVDVEGAEMKLLTGMKDTLSQQRPVIFIEIIDELLKKFGYAYTDIYHFLSRYGYTAYEIIKPGLLKRIQEPVESYNVIFLPANYPLPAGIMLR